MACRAYWRDVRFSASAAGRRRGLAYEVAGTRRAARPRPRRRRRPADVGSPVARPSPPAHRVVRYDAARLRREPAADRAVVAARRPARAARRARDRAGARRRARRWAPGSPSRRPSPSRRLSRRSSWPRRAGRSSARPPGTCEPSGATRSTALDRGDLDAAVEVNLRAWVDGPSRAAGRRRSGDPGVRRRDAARRIRAARVGRRRRAGDASWSRPPTPGSPRSPARRWSSSARPTRPRRREAGEPARRARCPARGSSPGPTPPTC